MSFWEKLTYSGGSIDRLGGAEKYRIECKSSYPDGRIAIRLFEYDAQIALDEGEIREETLTIEEIAECSGFSVAEVEQLEGLRSIGGKENIRGFQSII